jgi:ElaB/YqjD/DUF883 family membrane-anchored ribosome-binding protein
MKQNSSEKLLPEKVKSIDHALKTLDEAAKDSTQEIRKMVLRDYARLKSILGDVRPEVGDALHEIGTASYESIQRAKENAVKSTKAVANSVDETVHASPWAFIGGAVGVGALLGFLIGRGSR